MKHNLRVEYQEGRPENVAFFLKGVLFVMIHIIAPADGYYDAQEWSLRHSDNADFVELQIRKHVKHGYMNRVVLFGHARPRWIHSDFFNPVKSLANEFPQIPFTYIHGKFCEFLSFSIEF